MAGGGGVVGIAGGEVGGADATVSAGGFGPGALHGVESLAGDGDEGDPVGKGDAVDGVSAAGLPAVEDFGMVLVGDVDDIHAVVDVAAEEGLAVPGGAVHPPVGTGEVEDVELCAGDELGVLGVGDVPDLDAVSVAVDGGRGLVAVVMSGGGVESVVLDPESVAVPLEVDLLEHLDVAEILCVEDGDLSGAPFTGVDIALVIEDGLGLVGLDDADVLGVGGGASVDELDTGLALSDEDGVTCGVDAR